jgi:dihydrofolate reductase
MHIALFAAVAENGVIGRDNGLPWRLSTDQRRFKALTMGKPLVMGRKTWESFPRQPLPGRPNIVITRDQDFRAEGADVAHSLDEALRLARERAGGADEICVIGGGEIYAQAIGIADRLYITHVRASPEGDTRFPPIDPAVWEAVSTEDHPDGEKDSHPTRFAIYRRRRARSGAQA